MRKTSLAAFLPGLAAVLCLGLGSSASAQQASADEAKGASFIQEFDRLNTSFWYVSDGWSNGAHQNCTWSRQQVRVEDGKLKLGFEAAKAGDRNYACGEVQTRARYGYGTYEVRMKAGSGSGLNSAFFTYIGPADKQAHDEIDFEVLGKNTRQVQLNQYVSGKGGNEKLVPLAQAADEAFTDYAFIWEADRIRYFVNAELVHEVTDKAKIPSSAQKIFLSFWGSDKLTNWMGAFSYSAPSTLEVERVAFTARGEDCRFPDSILCKLD